jgi:hypothetical protein
MAVSAVGPVGPGSTVYAVSPHLNGAVRTRDAVTAAQASVRVVAIAAQVAPFANPAITQIAQKTAIATAIAAPPQAPTDSVLKGDSGTLVQAYGAVALIEPPLAVAANYAQPVTPAIPPVAPVIRIGRAYTRVY